MIEIDKGKENVNKVFEELEQEVKVGLRNHVKNLLNILDKDFNKLQNDIKEMINNAG